MRLCIAWQVNEKKCPIKYFRMLFEVKLHQFFDEKNQGKLFQLLDDQFFLGYLSVLKDLTFLFND